jgi:hypothetical protein
MNKKEAFTELCENLKVKNITEIDGKYKRITNCLNSKYYDSWSETDNSMQVGSVGRKTAIDGVSDLDLNFILPYEVYKRFNGWENNGQSGLLQEIRECVKKTYPKTEIKGDGQVVVISFHNYHVELCPVFLNTDNSFTYPDSNKGGKWKITNPKPEIDAIEILNTLTNGTLIRLCQMIRAWKNKVGLKMGGLLIDTLCYNFLKQEFETYKNINFDKYDQLVRAFFGFLTKTNEEQKFWFSPGSNQKVYKKKNFIPKAKRALRIIVENEENETDSQWYKKWRKIFGRTFPCPQPILESSQNYTSKEEFITDFFTIDITNDVKIDCLVTQNGFREALLSKIPFLKVNKKLLFYIDKIDVQPPYEVKWKVKNQGKLAKERNHLRGQILDDSGKHERQESSNFAGAHYVECFIIKDNVCIARDRIDVPISI